MIVYYTHCFKRHWFLKPQKQINYGGNDQKKSIPVVFRVPVRFFFLIHLSDVKSFDFNFFLFLLLRVVLNGLLCLGFCV